MLSLAKLLFYFFNFHVEFFYHLNYLNEELAYIIHEQREIDTITCSYIAYYDKKISIRLSEKSFLFIFLNVHPKGEMILPYLLRYPVTTLSRATVSRVSRGNVAHAGTASSRVADAAHAGLTW